MPSPPSEPPQPPAAAPTPRRRSQNGRSILSGEAPGPGAGREVLLVYKKSRLRLAVENKNARITALLEANDPSVAPMQHAAVAHDRSVSAVDHALKAAGCTVQRVYRARLRPEDTRGRLVVCVGGDGTVLDASHRIFDDSVVLGVNSDPQRSIGFFCAADAAGFADVLDDLLCHRLTPTPLQRLGGSIDGRPLPVPALNELLVGHKSPASTSRYRVERHRHGEDHKSSGLYVSTAAGSTAAMCSAGGEIQGLDDRRLQWRVRELLTLPAAAATRVAHQHEAFFFDAHETITLTSRMREGRVWIDGPHVAVDLPMGARLELHGLVAPLQLVVTPAMIERRLALINHL